MNHRHYAWDCIHELEGQKLLSIPEKEALCEKISRTVNRPSAALVVLVKVLPFFAMVLLFAGLKLTETTVLGWGVLIIAICYLAAALFLYLVKEVWVYDRWKETSKTIMKQDVYAVPVEAGQVWEAGDKTGGYLLTIRYTADEDFADIYRIPEETYQKMDGGKLVCYYYKGAREKYKGPYKIFYIDIVPVS